MRYAVARLAVCGFIALAACDQEATTPPASGPTAFLAENAQRPEVKTTASGLQYEVLEDAGDGPSPKPTDMVTVHYAGRLVDGTEFDSSIKRGEPATFPLDRVIKGWTEGLQLMSPGDKYRFYIPADLAYGAAGRPPVIPQNATLIFDVELIRIDAPQAN